MKQNLSKIKPTTWALIIVLGIVIIIYFAIPSRDEVEYHGMDLKAPPPLNPIAKGVAIGMTTGQVKEIYGLPDHSSFTQREKGFDQFWHYDHKKGKEVLYFIDGRLTSITKSSY